MPPPPITLPTAIDTVILGGGPAGLAAAIALRQKNIDCLVVEALLPPIDKGCGEGLMPDALHALARLGVTLDAAQGYGFEGIRFLNATHTAQAPFPNGTGLGVRRPVLHQALIDRAQALGVRLAWGHRAQLDSPNTLTIDGTQLRFRHLIGADGQASSVRHWAGLDAQLKLRQRVALRRHYRIAPWSHFVEIYWAAVGQAYVTPVAPDCVCVVIISRDPKADRAALLDSFPTLAARLGAAEVTTRQRGAVSITRRLRRVATPSVALLGDASGSADSITGEGLAMTFRQAHALAESIAAGDLLSYNRAHRLIARHPHRMGRLMLSLDRFPFLERLTLRTLAAHPRLFDKLLSIHLASDSPGCPMITPQGLSWG